MEIKWHEKAWGQYIEWQMKDKKILNKINILIKDIQRCNSKDGLGKPELLKGELSGYQSRRIDKENRIVYKYSDDSLYIIQCGGHYIK